jgi:hypothetical protein
MIMNKELSNEKRFEITSVQDQDPQKNSTGPADFKLPGKTPRSR